MAKLLCKIEAIGDKEWCRGEEKRKREALKQKKNIRRTEAAQNGLVGLGVYGA